MTLPKQTTEILELWQQHGIPEDLSTQEARDRLIFQLWEAYKELSVTVDELMEVVGDSCRPCVHGHHRDCIAASTDVCACRDRDREGERHDL